MPYKQHSKEFREVDELLRPLKPPYILDVPFLSRLLDLIRRYPQGFVNSKTKVETLLLNLVGTSEVGCELQSAPHPHFPTRDAEISTKVRIGSACFASLSVIKTSAQKSDRFNEFQLRLIYSLCDSVSSLVDFFGFPSRNFLPIQNHLSSKIKPFVPDCSASKQKMPSPEYVKLVYTRVDFFSLTLRNIFESGLNAVVQLNLPLIISFFSAMLSIDLTTVDRTPDELLLRSSQLIHCLCSLCRIVGPAVMPASATLFTLMTYQLNWTVRWSCVGKYNEGLARQRLATLNCLRIMIQSSSYFSSNRLASLLPRILEQLTEDLMFTGDMNIGRNSESAETASSDEQLTNVLIGRRMLLAVLAIVEELFSTPMFSCPQTIALHDSSNDNELRREISRLQLCLMHILQQITIGFPGGVPFKMQKWTSVRELPLLHPSVLSSLVKATYALLHASFSDCLGNIFIVLITELIGHQDSCVSSTARRCLTQMDFFLPSEFREDLEDASSTEKPAQTTVKPHSLLPPAVSQTDITPESTTKSVNKTDENDEEYATSKVHDENVSQKADDDEVELSPKRPRKSNVINQPMCVDIVPPSSDELTVSIPTSESVSVDICLSSFVPQFL
ncbi:unnamed protein product [Calicophoron daubneyi]|uniref:DUF5742 domain-containing protein n=1 Tax=Calicophoron daubneyi TaxID=300641 RepID=A0AAV2T9R5_CALDB